MMVMFAACSKDPDEKDNEPPVVTIASPNNNQVYNAGETVNITGTLSDNQKLMEVHVHIYNNLAGTHLMDIHRSPSAATYQLNESFQTQAGVTYTIQVVAKDNSANERLATVEISSH